MFEKSDINTLNSNYVVRGFILGNGDFDSIFSIEPKNYPHDMGPVIKIKNFNIEDGIKEAIKLDRIFTAINLSKDEMNLVRKYFLSNNGNPERLSF